ncbi:hypothetical protein, partial [Xanthomonas campestris]|uniref:hypothetical protein n=1 Tax=Xanthomonas campestris TaxID=339 RepID=UPI00403A66D7
MSVHIAPTSSGYRSTNPPISRRIDANEESRAMRGLLTSAVAFMDESMCSHGHAPARLQHARKRGVRSAHAAQCGSVITGNALGMQPRSPARTHHRLTARRV